MVDTVVAGTREFAWNVPETFNFASDVVDHWAKVNDGPCLIWENEAGETRSYTFSEMSLLTKKLASALAAQGIRKGDRVLVVMPRIPEWQIAMVAVMRIGAVPIPGIEMLTARDVEYRLGNSEAVAMICRGAIASRYEEPTRNLPTRIAVGDAPDGWLDFYAILDAAEPYEGAAVLQAEEPAIMYYTSGSTGHPKGVVHATRAIYAWRMSAIYWLDLRPGEIIWCTADTGWAKAGTSILYGPWSVGACAFFYDGPFVPAKRLELLSRHGVTVYCAPATELNRLVAEDIGAYDLSALRRTVSAGEAMNPVVAEKWKAATGVDVAEAFGQTEALMVALNMVGHELRLGSMGLPGPGIDLDIVDDQGRRLPSGEEGHIAMLTPNPQLMLGYWKDPERTAACFVTNGNERWYLTGDRGVRDEDGYLWYRGRTDDMINSAGYRIGPLEVENALLEVDEVLECAVVGLPDPERGEVVTAFVVLKEGVEGSPAMVERLQNHVKSVTAPYKYPRQIRFVDSLPKTTTGKIMRRALRPPR